MNTADKPAERGPDLASRKRVVINSLSGIVRLAAEVAVAFLLSPIIVHNLGNARYGLWELLLAIVGYMGFLELGVSPAVVQAVARASGSADHEAMRRTAATGAWMLGTLGLIGGTLIFLASPFGDAITNYPNNPNEPFWMLFALLGATMAAALPNNGFSAFLLGMQEHFFVNLVRIVITLARAVLVYYVMMYERDRALLYMAAMVFATEILESIVFVARIYMSHPGMSLRPKYFERQAARDLMVYGAKSTVLMASSSLVKRVTMLVIANEQGPAAVTYFAIVNRLVDYAHMFVMTLGVPLTSYFSHITGAADRGKLLVNWTQTTRMLMLVSLGAPIGVAWLGPPFIARWMGPEYETAGMGVLIVLCLGFFVESLAANCNRLLLATAQHGRIALWSIISAPICLGLSIVLGRQYGITGVAGAIAIYTAGQAWIELYRACGVLGVRVLDHLRATALRYTLPLLLFGSVMTLFDYYIDPDTYWEIVVCALVSGSIFVAASLAISWLPAERIALWGWIVQLMQGTLRKLR